MIWIAVDSSMIEKVKYGSLEEPETLFVQFKNGSIYTYSNVPHEVFHSLMNASSVGKYFHQYIKEQYPVKKIKD